MASNASRRSKATIWLLRTVGLLFGSMPLRAEAHHVVSEYGIASVEPRTTAELDVQLARFELEQRRGTWTVIASRLEYSLLPEFSVFTRVPLAHVRFSAGGTASGLGDVELGAKVRLYSTEHGGFIASAGVSSELPTGNAENGIGNGHVELSPFVVVSAEPTKSVVLHGVLADRLALSAEQDHHDSETPAHGHGSVIQPHEQHEAFARLAGSLILGRAFVSAGADAVYVISHRESVWAMVRTEAGYLLANDLRLALGMDVPVAGEPRFSWRGRVGVLYAF
jgi:hypothetical protein